MKIYRIEETGSTNAWMKERAGVLESPSMVTARCQTAGRGQRGNSWESEPGKNLTFSVFYRPRRLRASRQFLLSETVSLAMVDVLDQYGVAATVKWPNDIYVADGKVAGILIENSILGTDLSWAVIGIGLNVNQREFLGDAPNPISMLQHSGRAEDYDLEEISQATALAIENRLEIMEGELAGSLAPGIHEEYKRRLWRGDGAWHPYREAATGLEFEARIVDVEEGGMLSLQDRGGELRRYAFKEVTALLDPL